MNNQLNRIRRVKAANEKKWLTLPEVVGVGIGVTSTGETGIIVSVKENPQKIREKIPAEISGVPIEIRETGEFKAL